MESNRDKIETLRSLINKVIVSENYDADYLLKKSQELDELIVEVTKEMNFSKKVFGENSIDEFNVFLDDIRIVSEKYYSVKIIDPLTKEILELKKGDLYTENLGYYKYFAKQNIYEDVTLMSAWNKDELSRKFEKVNNKIFLVVGAPVFIKNRKLLIEFFKDITSSTLPNEVFIEKKYQMSI